MTNNRPVERELVLVGGGHAHVRVLTEFARRPLPGLRVTLVTRDLETPYSGMLPGVIAGHYRREEAYIDLVRLCAATRTRLVHAAADGLDRDRRRLLLENRPSLAYDLVSLDVGMAPDLDAIAGAADNAIAVKPIGAFLAKLDVLLARLRRPDGPRRIVGVGGGAGGVETLLALRRRVRAEARERALDPEAFTFSLVTAGRLLPTHHARVRDAFRRVLARQGVALFEDSPVAAIDAGQVRIAGGGGVAADAVLLTTHAAAPAWFRTTGLALDERGFLAVGPTLQSLDDPRVFAAGDCAALVESPREKAGVYAVRAGPPLARNLRRSASGEALREWRPQARHLALISTGGRHAIASRGCLCLEGDWVWTLKDRIDRRWMRQYRLR